MADQPKINGVQHSSSKVSIMLDGAKYVGVKSIQYKLYQREVSHNYAFGENPYGVSFGNIVTTDCTIVLFRVSAVDFVKKIAADTEKMFNVDIMYKQTPKAPAQHDMLENCVLIDVDSAIQASNSEALEMTIIVRPMRTRVDGVKFEKDA